MALIITHTLRTETKYAETAMTVYGEDLHQTKWEAGGSYPQHINKALSIFADESELSYIIANFDNIPYKYNSCVWTGEMADFIHNNLKQITK